MMQNAKEPTTFLTLGDGDFTFSLDLAHFLTERKQNSSWKVVATGIDSLSALQEKYRDSAFLLQRLHGLGQKESSHIEIIHGINAIQPPDGISRGHHVIFNHPHLGVEDAALHSRFLAHLFHAVTTSWLLENGLFYITLAQGQYERWQCDNASKAVGMKLVKRHAFSPPQVLGSSYYQQRRHQNGKSFSSRVLNSSTFVFARLVDQVSAEDKLPWATSVAEANEVNVTEFPCPYCDRTFTEKRSVKNHILNKHSHRKRKRDGPCACEVCGQLFDTEQGLADHHVARHTRSPNNVPSIESSENVRASSKCEICGCGIVDVDSHMASFRPPVANATFRCSFCHRCFHQDRAKLQHETRCAEQTKEGVRKLV